MYVYVYIYFVHLDEVYIYIYIVYLSVKIRGGNIVVVVVVGVWEQRWWYKPSERNARRQLLSKATCRTGSRRSSSEVGYRTSRRSNDLTVFFSSLSLSLFLSSSPSFSNTLLIPYYMCILETEKNGSILSYSLNTNFLQLCTRKMIIQVVILIISNGTCT